MSINARWREEDDERELQQEATIHRTYTRAVDMARGGHGPTGTTAAPTVHEAELEYALEQLGDDGALADVVDLWSSAADLGPVPAEPAPTVNEMLDAYRLAHPVEEWRAVVGYEGLYEVSDLGRVRSLDRITPTRGNGQQLRRGMVLRATPNPGGYPTVGIHVGGKARTRLVHSLVAESFIGPRPEGMEVCHGDGDRDNPALTNLRYGTRSDNERDKVAHGTHHEARKTHCPAGHAYDEENTYWSPRGERRCHSCRRGRDARRKLTAQELGG